MALDDYMHRIYDEQRMYEDYFGKQPTASTRFRDDFTLILEENGYITTDGLDFYKVQNVLGTDVNFNFSLHPNTMCILLRFTLWNNGTVIDKTPYLPAPYVYDCQFVYRASETIDDDGRRYRFYNGHGVWLIRAHSERPEEIPESPHFGFTDSYSVKEMSDNIQNMDSNKMLGLLVKRIICWNPFAK